MSFVFFDESFSYKDTFFLRGTKEIKENWVLRVQWVEVNLEHQ